MIITGYTNEYGTVIPMEEAEKYIRGQVNGNEERKQWFIDYALDALTGSTKEAEKLKEAFFNDVCSDKEVDEQGNDLNCIEEYIEE